MSSHRPIAFGLAAAAVALLTLSISGRGIVRADSTWTDPALIFSTAAYVTRPILTGDSEGAVHLLFVLRETTDTQTQAALMYARMQDNRWSAPTDVLVSPDGGPLDLPALTLDPQGFLHVVWQGGPSNEIYYSRAHVARAGSARGWSPPERLSTAGGNGADIAASQEGVLHLVFASRQGDIYYRRSVDGGRTWSQQEVISDIKGERVGDYPHVAIDSRGRIHVVWTQFESRTGAPPFDSTYTRSQDGGTTWSPPEPVADDTAAELSLAVMGDDGVQLAWAGSAGSGDRKYQWSADGGQTWANVQTISGALRGGSTSDLTMAAVGSNSIHLLTSAGGQAGRASDVYHMVWDGQRWTEPELLSVGAVGQRSVAFPAFAVGGGNRMYAVYVDDFQRIWYRSRVSDTADVAIQPVLPAPPDPTSRPRTSPLSPTLVATPEVRQTPASASTAPNPGAVAASSGGAGGTSPSPLFSSTVVVVILLSGLLIFRAARRS